MPRCSHCASFAALISLINVTRRVCRRSALFYDSIDSEERGAGVHRAAGAELGGDDQRKDEL